MASLCATSGPAPAVRPARQARPQDTSYSYRLSHDHQQKLLAALDTKMISALATANEAIFDLDFHAVMHWGHHPVPRKSTTCPPGPSAPASVLTFFAQDTGTHNLVYANADISKATQNREAIAFCDHWKQVSGSDPKMLIMDQKVTTQAVLGELDARGVKFATLRMRSPVPGRSTSTALASQGLQDRDPGPARPAQPAPRRTRTPP